MGVCFQINAWAACAPGLATAEQWQHWAASPCLPAGECEVALPEVPAMLRRRLSPLGRMCASVARQCQGDRAGVPIVFASRYGDADRSLALLGGFAADEPMSPADFALSVHNAIGAMYSIVRSDTNASTTIAAGAASAAVGCIEAASLLADGAPEVMLVCYDAPLPGDYRAFESEPAAPFAWAWAMTAASDGARSIRLDWDDAHADGESSLPFGLDAMRFVLSGGGTWQRASGGRRWHWSRHA